MKRASWHLMILALLAVFTLSLQTSIQAQADKPTFTPGDCPVEIPEDQTVDCGTLTVPEDRAVQNSPKITLAVAIIRSPNGNPQPDPFVYLEGGPGGSAIDGIDAWYDTVYGENRDMILIDQRGTGYSQPFLGCPETLDLPEDANDLEYAEACRDALKDEGVNLAAYTSAASAADINDLRIALGYDQINLYGISYGTRLALTVMRDFPQGIRSVVLDSTYPPQVAGYDEEAINADRAFKVLFDGCAKNSACNSAYPDLEKHFYDAVDQLNKQPVTVDLGEGDQDFTGDDLINLIFDSLYDTSMIPYLPAIIDEGGQGKFDLYLSLLDEGEGGDEVTTSDFVDDFTQGTHDDDLYAAFEDQLLVYLKYDDYDAMYDYLDSLRDDDYFALLDKFTDEMPDADFDELMSIYLGYDNIDDMNDYLDGLADEDYNMVLNNFYMVIYGEYEDVTDVSDSDGMFNSVECYEEIP
ncbi:MAG TPA: alpha/beta fold hydrolase, partial [Phototrophicaceae bacterium]|nr:alpha/beta fold hydrolase [Phototrophicaceae bacterium]